MPVNTVYSLVPTTKNIIVGLFEPVSRITFEEELRPVGSPLSACTSSVAAFVHIMETAKAFFTERGSMKARLTIFKSFLESESTSADLMALEKRVRANESLYEIFNSVESRIECAVIGTPHEEAQLAEREQFEDSVSAANYKLAWERLQEKYNDPKLLATHHLNSILDAEPLKKPSGKGLSEFVDTTINNERALESILKPAELWDALISACLARKLDAGSLDEWDKRTTNSSLLPTFRELSKFLEQRSQYLDRRKSSRSSVSKDGADRPRNRAHSERAIRTFVPATHVASKIGKCVVCNEQHVIAQCPKFLAMPFSKRFDTVKETTSQESLVSKEDREPSSSNVLQACSANVHSDCVVLSTASVLVADGKGRYHKCRALLDVGSQANFVTREFCEHIGLPRLPTEKMVSGLGRVQNRVQSSAQIKLKSASGHFKSRLSCLVIETITEEMPNIPLDKIRVPVPTGVELADPEFQTPGRIDLLIGAGIFWDLLCVGQIKLRTGDLILQKTRLGWLLGGSLRYPTQQSRTVSFHAATNTEVENSLSRFWEVEEISTSTPLFDPRDPCEQHFTRNTRRDKEGRFIVAIPFNERLH
ncbi:uncharacterized protein LOC143259843 [Megalopta genalis]|uniref:uncharacterized protein LOC143259843 n=1 Tax=Megalopta genalis TaxID=115081 RepID=UPI003FD5B0F9